MAYTLGDLFTAVRDRSAYFDKARVPRGPLMRTATDVQRDLLRKAAQRAPDAFTATTVLTLTQPVTTQTAITLPAYLEVIRVETDFTGASPKPEPTTVIPVSRIYDYQHNRAVYLLNGSLYLTGESTDWSTVSQLTVYYLPLPVPFAAETDNWTLPDDAHDVFTARVALMAALRVNGTPVDNERPTSPPIQIDVGAFQSFSQEAEYQWMKALTTQVRQARVANRSSASAP